MCIGEWSRIVAETPPQMPVLFYLPEPTQKLPASDIYFDGLQVEVSRYWDWRQGWLPCVMVTLKEEDSFF